MNIQHSFITKWQIKAPLAEVWEIIYNSEEWPEWWRGCIQVKRLAEGNDFEIGSVCRYTWKGVFPYKLRFDLCLTDKQDHKMLRATASGDLTGLGTWLFEENEGVTDIVCYWNVRTTKIWMNYFSFLLKPVFKLNHDIIMSWGKDGLCDKLNASCIAASTKTEPTLPLLGV